MLSATVTAGRLAGQRLSAPRRPARLLPGDRVELLGRDPTVINTGGEKVLDDEVEAAVRSPPDVLDAVVCGRPSERWGPRSWRQRRLVAS